MENWKDIKGFEGLYQVSDTGKVKAMERYVSNPLHGRILRKEIILKPGIPKKKRCDYALVVLNKEGVPKTHKVHRLVAEAFLPNPLHKPQVNHIDGNKLNNCVENLEWADNSENQIHAYSIGLKKSVLKGRFGERHPHHRNFKHW